MAIPTALPGFAWIVRNIPKRRDAGSGNDYDFTLVRFPWDIFTNNILRSPPFFIQIVDGKVSVQLGDIQPAASARVFIFPYLSDAVRGIGYFFDTAVPALLFNTSEVDALVAEFGFNAVLAEVPLASLSAQAQQALLGFTIAPPTPGPPSPFGPGLPLTPIVSTGLIPVPVELPGGYLPPTWGEVPTPTIISPTPQPEPGALPPIIEPFPVPFVPELGPPLQAVVTPLPPPEGVALVPTPAPTVLAPPVQVIEVPGLAPITIVQPAPPAVVLPPISTVINPPPGNVTVLAGGTVNTTVPVNVTVNVPSSAPPLPLPLPVQLVGQALNVRLPGAEALLTGIMNRLGFLADDINQVSQRIADDIHAGIAVLEPKAIEIGAHAATTLAQIQKTFAVAFPDATWLTDQLANFTMEIWPIIKKDVQELVGAGGLQSIAAAFNNWVHNNAPDPKALLGDLGKLECLPEGVRNFLVQLGGLTPVLGLVTGTIGISEVVRRVIDAAMTAILMLIEQEGMKCARPELASIADLQEARRRNLIDYPTYAEWLQLRGLSDGLISMMSDLQVRLFDRRDIAVGWFRKYWDLGTAVALLQKLGYTDADANRVLDLEHYAPTPQDVIQWLLRDVFIPEFVEAFGMDLEFPEAATPWFDRIGVPNEIARNFWRSHWELPSIMQGFEMYQRSKIDELSLRRLLRAKGVEPFWRDPLIAISYLPITRVDIRRIHKMHLLDHAGLLRRYRDVGYSPPDAELLAQFTERLNSDTDKAAKLGDVAFIRGHIETAVLDGVMSPDDADAALKGLGFLPDHVDALVAWLKYLRIAKLKGKERDAIGKHYIAMLWNKQQTANALAGRGIPGDEQARLFEDWDIERDLRELTAQEKAHRELNRGEVIDSFKEHVIDEATARTLLEKIHYTAPEVDTLIALAKIHIAKADQRTVIEAQKALYLSGQADRNEVIGSLDAVGVSPQRRTALLATWDTQAFAKTARLTVAQLQSMFVSGIIDESEVRHELTIEGYSVHDIDNLIELFQNKKNTAVGKKKGAGTGTGRKAALATMIAASTPGG